MGRTGATKSASERIKPLAGLYTICEPQHSDSPVAPVDENKKCGLHEYNDICGASHGPASDAGLVEPFSHFEPSIGDPLRCLTSKLRIRLSDKTIVYFLTATYRGGLDAARRFAFLFPVSESPAALTSLSVRINGRVLFGRLARAENSVLYSVSPDAAAAAYGPNGAALGADVRVDVRWTTAQPQPCDGRSAKVAYALRCAPRAPDSIVCRAQFSLPVARVQAVSGAESHMLEWRARGGRCRVRVAEVVKDAHVFALMFHFTDGSDAVGRGLFGIGILVAIAAVFLWFMLTKDLKL